MSENFNGEKEVALLPEENEPKVNLSAGDTIFSKSGTTRTIESVDHEGETFSVLRRSTDGKVTEEKLSFDQLNAGINGVDHILHPDGKIDFFNLESELKYLENQKKEEEEDFKNGKRRLRWSSLKEHDLRDKRITELTEKLNKN
jgi:hypothetical protein